MNTSSYVLLISTVIVLIIDDISSEPNPQLERLNALFNSGARKSELSENEADDDSEVKTMSLNMNITDLYEICKTYNQSNPTVINNQLGKVIPQNGMSKKTRTDINLGLESSCSNFFTREPIKHLMEAHQKLSKQSLTVNSPKFMKSPKVNLEKAKQLGKPVVTYNVTTVPVVPMENLPSGYSPIVGSVSKSTPVRRESGESEKSIEPPDVFPNKNSGPIQVVQVPGHEPVVTPSPELNAPDSFPTNPQYDLTNITKFQKKISALMEKINHIVEHNNTYDNLHGGLDVINVINELKVNLDQWSRSVNTSNEASKIKQENETLQTNLLKSKVYLAQLIHELAQNKTDPSELTCKINNLYEEIQNLTNIDIGFFNMAVDNDELKMNCNETINWNCTETNTTVPAHHAETDIENLPFHPNIVAILAICFAVISILSYVGLISWRYFLERRYGTRQLLTNEDTEFYDSAPDIHPFEIRTEQL